MAAAQRTDVGDVVYVAPERAKRPRGTQSGVCPFCPGNEALTPPTLQQIPEHGAWRARAFQNRFPITREHEVVIDTPRHVLTFADLEPDEAARALRLYRDRTRRMADDGLEYLLFRNEGPSAGGSIPHSHAQIVAEAEGFPRPRGAAGTSDGGFRRVSGTSLFEAGVPAVARFPYELWIRPNTAGAGFHEATDDETADLADLLLRASKAMVERAGTKGWNLVLHRRAGGWRFEMLPRTEAFAGLELGGGVYVNAVEADAAASWWAQALAPNLDAT